MSDNSVLHSALPSDFYTDSEPFAREKAAIFEREWVVVCRVEEIARAGDWRVFDVVGNDVLVVRGADAVLRAFYNVCRHRGARLCAGHDDTARSGRAILPGAVLGNGMIRCPYHAWLYRADGTLAVAPHVSDKVGFAAEGFGLYPVACADWGGFVFLHLTPERAAPLLEQLGAVPERVARYDLATLRIGHQITYHVDANWKILCENYNECYHCGPLHPELCALVPAFRTQGGASLDWERGVAHREGAYTFSWSGSSRRALLPGLNADERVRHKGELIYPNLFISLAADHVTAYILCPRGPALTEVICLFLFAASEIAGAGFDHTDCSSFWDVVNQQDWAICERVQQGMRARPHRQGYYAPMEDANLDMRRYVMDRLQRV